MSEAKIKSQLEKQIKKDELWAALHQMTIDFGAWQKLRVDAARIEKEAREEVELLNESKAPIPLNASSESVLTQMLHWQKNRESQSQKSGAIVTW